MDKQNIALMKHLLQKEDTSKSHQALDMATWVNMCCLSTNINESNYVTFREETWYVICGIRNQLHATYFPMDTQPANRIWLPTQPRHYTTREKIPLSRQHLKMGTRWPETCWASYKEQLIRRNKYNTKWHLVGFLFHIELRCTVNHTSKWYVLFQFQLAPRITQCPSRT